MERTGIVVKISGSIAFVSFKGSCPEGCAACPMGRMFMKENGEICEIKAVNLVDAKIGDHVRLELDARTTLLAYGLAYGVPLLGLVGGILSGAFVANFFGWKQTIVIGVFGFCGLGLGFFYTLQKGKRFIAHPYITNVLSSEKLNNHQLKS